MGGAKSSLQIAIPGATSLRRSGKRRCVDSTHVALILTSLSPGSLAQQQLRSCASSPATLAEPVGGLLFAGEATNSAYFGTVHGALDSGRREAERILKWTRNPAPHFDK